MESEAIESPASDTPAAPTAPDVVSAPVAASDVAAPASAPADGPRTMAEAMWLRDEQGRFTGRAEPGKTQAEPGAAVPGAATAAPAAAPVVPAAVKPEDDITAMPEGLGQKAQERFQRLATTNRELSERVTSLEPQVNYIRDTFQQHGVQQEQFEQAVTVIGALNRGDYQTAKQILIDQLRHVSLLTGEPMAGVDALADFPDLRQQVDGLQMAEQTALELARLRKGQQAMQQHQAQQNQQREQQQASEREFTQAQTAVDKWVRQMAAQDIDWPVLEEQLLPDIKNLLQGVPPSRWLSVMQTQYSVLKRAATTFRRSAAPNTPAVNPLRPSGAGAPQRAPTSMYEAMWAKGGA
jgi:hypothetical protein